MNASGRFESFVVLQRQRHGKRLWMALLVGGLIALLTYETQWPGLRAGLLVLLAGQLGDVVALLLKRLQLARTQVHDDQARIVLLAAEERFIHQLSRFDTISQAAGFLLLGRALWTSTGNLWLALAVGVVYPLTAYFGMTRARNAAALRDLTAMKPVERS